MIAPQDASLPLTAVPDFAVGPWLVQPAQLRVCRGDREETLEPKVMQVLVCLAANAGDVVSRDRLMEDVWTNTIVVDDTLTRCISRLRKVFGDTPSRPRVIETIRKHGYRLVLPVGAAPSAARPSRRASRWATLRDLSRFSVARVLGGGLLGILLYVLGLYSGVHDAPPKAAATAYFVPGHAPGDAGEPRDSVRFFPEDSFGGVRTSPVPFAEPEGLPSGEPVVLRVDSSMVWKMRSGLTLEGD